MKIIELLKEGVKITPQEFTKILKDEIKKCRQTPKEINSGWCDEFSFSVLKRVPDAEEYYALFDNDPLHNHYLIKWGGKYYDAENTNGVKKISDLILFKRGKHKTYKLFKG